MTSKRPTAPETGAPQIELRPLDSLIAYARNSRTHSGAQIEQLKAAMVEFGFTNPILADAKGIIAGHGRCMAVRALYDGGHTLRFPNGQPIPAGMVPVVDCTGWSDAQRRAYVIADNKLALNAGWDLDMLRIEMADLKTDDFDLTLTGFDLAELDGLSAADLGREDDGAEPGKSGAGSLAERFGVPPFTVLNAREGWWQDRKRAWLSLGIQSEMGRGANAQPGGSPDPLAGALAGDQSIMPDKPRKPRKANAVPGGPPMPLDRRKGR